MIRTLISFVGGSLLGVGIYNKDIILVVVGSILLVISILTINI
jgi:hypothetical protein